jgi:hypothetical protein
MTIPSYAQTNFRTLLRAAADGNLALMECLDARTREPRYVLCAVGRNGPDRVFTPFGHLAEGNPFEDYFPPDPKDPGGYMTQIRSPSTGHLPADGENGVGDADPA